MQNAVMTNVFKLKTIIIFTLLVTLGGCVYRLDIQQGNILAQKDIDKLRPDLTKEQVLFVLGSPVVDDGFTDDTWIYLYSYRDSDQNKLTKKQLVLEFVDDKLKSARGDYDIPETLLVVKQSDTKPSTPAESDPS